MQGSGIALACAVVGACSSGPQASQASRAVQDAAKAQAELKRELGVDSSLVYGYIEAPDGGGRRFDVQVRYSQRPEGDPAQVQEKTEAIVKRNFRAPVTSVTVRF